MSAATHSGQTSNGLAILGVLVPPVVATVALYLSTYVFGIEADEPYTVLAVLTFVITLVIYREMAAMASSFARQPRDFLQRSLAAWAIVVSCLAVLAFALQYGEVFSRLALMSWAVLTPLLIASAQYWIYTFFIQRGARDRTVVIAGISDLSRRLVRAINDQPELGLSVKGCFEDRSLERTGPLEGAPVIGRLADLPEYVKEHRIDVIYIALPIRHEERTRLLLDELHDTTASIYFVPDIFVFDLIQSRVDVLDGIPVVALCETPFVGFNGLVKRSADLLLASLLLVLTMPLMLAVAVGVAVSTSGSVVFKQRRYGLDGEEIIVYKFRSMTTSDDDDNVPQAQREDSRVTPFGRFIRRYSLDELPQFVNVLQGRMSLVGPRPHAIAHNEQYRRLIKGYMIRHKVAPGITGLAQIRGFRGETETVEQMQQRIEADLEYLRRWSVALDLKILIATVLRVFRDSRAY